MFGNDFRDKITKNKFLTKNSFHVQILLKTFQMNLNLLLENKYSQTKPKLKIGQKLLKHTKYLGKSFRDQAAKQFSFNQKLFV